jgi:hypothetical protein
MSPKWVGPWPRRKSADIDPGQPVETALQTQKNSVPVAFIERCAGRTRLVSGSLDRALMPVCRDLE